MAVGSTRDASDLSVTIANVTTERQLQVRAVVVTGGMLITVVGICICGCISSCGSTV